MNSVIDKAWKLYCDDTRGGMDVRDFWEELPMKVQTFYLNKAFDAAILAERELCAKVCEDFKIPETVIGADKDYLEGKRMAVHQCATAIRARTNND